MPDRGVVAVREEFMGLPACKHEGCGHTALFLGEHLSDAHGETVEAYLDAFPGAEVVSDRVIERLRKSGPEVRKAPDAVTELYIDFAGYKLRVNYGVPKDACLPCPFIYRVPEHGKLKDDIREAALSILAGRHTFIAGPPGCGKDAVVHAISDMGRKPAILIQVRPNADLEALLGSRAFRGDETYWEEGPLLVAARDGYTAPDGTKHPYLILFSDIDRATPAGMETLRLILDSISGRVPGPDGVVHEMFPGTQIVATANSTGGGDIHGRCISSNPIDSSIMDRFQRGYQFHWLDWRDEEKILRDKFPLFVEKAEALLPTIGKITEAIRGQIMKDEISMEFSHRALEAWLGHAEDILRYGNHDVPPPGFLARAARCWMDKAPDPDTYLALERILQPYTGSKVGNR